jgi:hypothetical protein
MSGGSRYRKLSRELAFGLLDLDDLRPPLKAGARLNQRPLLFLGSTRRERLICLPANSRVRHKLAPVCSWRAQPTEHFDCDIRAEVVTARAIFAQLRNIEPIAIDTVARGSDGAENIVRGHLLAARIRADPGEHQHFRIRASRLRCSLPDEICVHSSVSQRALRLNVDDIGIPRGIGGNPQPQIGIIAVYSAFWRQHGNKINGGGSQE